MKFEATQQGQALILATRIVALTREDGQRVVRASALNPANLPNELAEFAQAVQDQIHERFVEWTDGRLSMSSNASSANLKMYVGPQGVSFHVVAPQHRALIDQEGHASTAANAAWIIRDKLRQHWSAGFDAYQECQS